MPKAINKDDTGLEPLIFQFSQNEHDETWSLVTCRLLCINVSCFLSQTYNRQKSDLLKKVIKRFSIRQSVILFQEIGKNFQSRKNKEKQNSRNKERKDIESFPELS